MDPSVEAALLQFLGPPKGSDLQSITDKVRYWIDVSLHPEQFSEDKNPFAIAAKRRSAKQNVRRLLKKHPEVAVALLEEARQ